MAKKSFDIKIPTKDNKDILTTVGEFTQAHKPIEVLPELENFITPLSKEALEQLEENILEEGIREPLLVWIHGEREILVDGHNRFNIAQKHNLPYKKIRKNFRGMEEVKKWMIQNQLGRRNLTDLELSYFRGLLYHQKKSGWGGKREAEGTNAKTVELVAEEYKVNERTILRDKLLYQGLEKIGNKNPVLKRQILTGEVKVPKGKLQKLADLEEDEVGSLEDIYQLLDTLGQDRKSSEGSQLKELVSQLKGILADIVKSKDKQKLRELEKGIERLRKLL
ncbi:ParB N-terminal domain-containing protein [Telluribacter humicola]|uniref:ParB N-terminal domain-containing protein n=1 Tax=Telluribacter humicola TaxID=1720261 RepID=UPI001A9716CC|nr:ParB N-terminal domain-containing protein [Telluribacter humicola]